MPEIQHMHISLPFSKSSSSYCQACFPWVPWSPSPLISIAFSLVRMASSCLSPCVEACFTFLWYCTLNKYVRSNLTHEYSIIISLHSITDILLCPFITRDEDENKRGKGIIYNILVIFKMCGYDSKRQGLCFTFELPACSLVHDTQYTIFIF